MNRRWTSEEGAIRAFNNISFSFMLNQSSNQRQKRISCIAIFHIFIRKIQNETICCWNTYTHKTGFLQTYLDCSFHNFQNTYGWEFRKLSIPESEECPIAKGYMFRDFVVAVTKINCVAVLDVYIGNELNRCLRKCKFSSTTFSNSFTVHFQSQSRK